jgi:elongation factor P
MYLQANRIRVGHLIEFEGQPCKVLESIHKTPGNLRAFVQVKLRNLRTGVQFETRLRAVEDIKRVSMDERAMEFLYAEGDTYHFMESQTYEQIGVHKDVLGDMAPWLKENTTYQIEYFDGSIVGVEFPPAVDLEVRETTPGLRGATATNSPKPALLENGVTINVPPFIEVGEKVRVNPETGEYLERVKG